MVVETVPDRSRTAARRAVLAVLVALFASGCGAIGYTVDILEATEAVEEAHTAGAETVAPYEYFYAAAMLDKAREEAGQAEYQTAMDLANQATEYGGRARDLARRRGRESGR